MEDSLENKDKGFQEKSDVIDFYIVSPQKALILFIGTFGIYSVYWFFKHWSQYTKSTNDNMWPAMRAIFSIFFVHSLFDLFEMKYSQKNGELPKSINYLATIYVVFSVLGQVCTQLFESGYENPLTLVFSFLSLPITGWVIYKSQSLANYSGIDVHGASNNKLTAVNYLWVIIISGLLINGALVS